MNTLRSLRPVPATARHTAASACITPNFELDADALDASLAQYGIDERTRSALQAFVRFAGGDGVRRALAAELDLAFPPPAQLDQAATNAYQRFVMLLADLPARGLDRDWLRELVRLWLVVATAGVRADTALRITREMLSLVVQRLCGERQSYSRLEAEIAMSLGNVALFVCGVLAEAVQGQHREWLRQLEQFDSETLLPNGAQTRVLLEQSVAAAGAALTGVLLMNMDFSAVGLPRHDGAWSQMLMSGLDRVRQALRADDILCRVGRTEFFVILPHLASRAQVMLAASKLQRAVEHPVRFGSHEARMALRIGAACAPDHGLDAQALMQCARLALQETGNADRWFVLYADELRLRAENEALLEAELLRALDAGALELYLQPQIDVRTGRCASAEALLRWRDERGQMVPPTEVIELARRAGVLAKLTHWVVHQSCQLADALRREGAAIRLSVNLTASDIGDSDLPDVVRDALALWHVPASSLLFELTETAMLSNEADGIEVMSRLRELGCMTSIDDFGTGYSSVLYLRKLPLDELKIDKEFVGRVTQSDQDKEIVRSLVHLAHGLGLQVVAEGVEDHATLALLREYGCERVQGYVFSTPLPFEAFVDWWHMHERTNLQRAAAAS